MLLPGQLISNKSWQTLLNPVVNMKHHPCIHLRLVAWLEIFQSVFEMPGPSCWQESLSTLYLRLKLLGYSASFLALVLLPAHFLPKGEFACLSFFRVCCSTPSDRYLFQTNIRVWKIYQYNTKMSGSLRQAQAYYSRTIKDSGNYTGTPLQR